jgi:para-aminobenzoate synthetase component 1
MGGRLATELISISHDPHDLSDGGFWAITTDFEGGFIGAKFAHVVHAEFPRSSWKGIEGKWRSSFSQQQYVEYVEKIRDLISQGWVYQVNACRVLSISDDSENLRGLFSEILEKTPHLGQVILKFRASTLLQLHQSFSSRELVHM